VHLEIKSIDATDCEHSENEIQSLGAAYRPGTAGEVTLSAVALSGIIVGCLALATLAFVAGRWYDRKGAPKPGYDEPPAVEVVSIMT
jgi:hypothetical protein